MKRFWNALRDWFGFYVPADVAPSMPKTLAEFRQRKAEREETAKRVRRAVEHGEDIPA